MNYTPQRESVDRAIGDLEVTVGCCDAITAASVSAVTRAGDRWAVSVDAETFSAVACRTGEFAFRPRFASRLDAEAFRSAALEIVSCAA